MSDLLERMRGLESDHTPDGWPAVQMRDISALCDRIEQVEARAAELEGALVWALGKLSIEVPVTGGNVSYIRAFEKADKALSSDGRAYLLRKQAEAVNYCISFLGGVNMVRDMDLYAQSLLQQADEAERAGGETNGRI